ncbi:MAG: hypothetical protein V4671_09400 [Armatimonadota bacterium]
MSLWSIFIPFAVLALLWYLEIRSGQAAKQDAADWKAIARRWGEVSKSWEEQCMENIKLRDENYARWVSALNQLEAISTKQFSDVILTPSKPEKQ